MTTLAEKLAATAATMKEEIAATDPEVVETADQYVSTNGSQRGYQWAGGILRPNSAGIYVAKTREEKNLCEALVVSGQLQSHI